MEIRFSLTPRLSLLGALCLMALLALAFFTGMRVERLTADPVTQAGGAPHVAAPRTPALHPAPSVPSAAVPQVPTAPTVAAPATPTAPTLAPPVAPALPATQAGAGR